MGQFQDSGKSNCDLLGLSIPTTNNLNAQTRVSVTRIVAMLLEAIISTTNEQQMITDKQAILDTTQKLNSSSSQK